jgi:hypothetical protein
VNLSTYKPTEVPYTITYGRGTSHSFYTDTAQTEHVECPGVPLMQMVQIPPKGGDLHQIVEHVNVCIKGHTGRLLSKACIDGCKACSLER